MSYVKRFGVVCAVVLLVLISRSARADEWDQLMVFTFSAPVEIPGVVLPAGTYQFKLADPLSDRSVITVLSADGSRVYATIAAVAERRTTPTDDPVVTLEARSKGSPQAIDTIFYPGEAIGLEFLYPQHRADPSTGSR
ncbi:MAG: hypothetical protein JWL71_4826 [Acidobacteria bacterium]|nr:hypothetical protein [Acidobacteriota bacterium]